jgi:large subunit ribosomal protein L10
MNREQKAAVVEEIAGEIREAEAVFAVDYRGLSVTQAAELRTRLRDADARFRVVKNSLTERAADQAGAEALRRFLDGPTALTFVRGDAAVAAKALGDAARTTRILQFKGGLLNGDAVTAEDIVSIGRLPSREVLYGQLVGVVGSPITGLVRALNALIAGLAVQLQQISEQGLIGDGESAPASEAPQAARAETQPPADQPSDDPDAEPPETPESDPSKPEGEDEDEDT